MNTNVFHRTLHCSLWQWLADNPSKSKEDWVGWKSNGGNIEEVRLLCFACEYSLKAKELLRTRQSGCICPLVWIDGYCFGYGLFALWRHSTGPTERTELALEIKDLPVKDGMVCD
jgi:hypothetical protein